MREPHAKNTLLYWQSAACTNVPLLQQHDSAHTTKTLDRGLVAGQAQGIGMRVIWTLHLQSTIPNSQVRSSGRAPKKKRNGLRRASAGLARSGCRVLQWRSIRQRVCSSEFQTAGLKLRTQCRAGVQAEEVHVPRS